MTHRNPPPFEVREMHILDYSSVARLWQETDEMLLREADSQENIQRYLDRNPGLSFVAVKPNCHTLIAAVLAGTDGRRGYVQHLAVDPRFRRQGIGESLLEKVTEALSKQGIDKTHLFVANDNAAAQQFYQRLGWQPRPEVSMYSLNTSQNPDV